mgnify:CR=1 FL=1
MRIGHHRLNRCGINGTCTCFCPKTHSGTCDIIGGNSGSPVVDREGRVIGLIPRLLMTTEIAQDGLDELHVVETLHERKALMHRLSDAIIALPGSIGTLDEFFESLTWRELGIHDKPIWLLGGNGYWAPLTALLAHISAAGFGPPHLAALAEPLENLEALSEKLG